jgi:plasmid stabilization system protein ParE
MRMDTLPATSAVRVGRLNVTCLVPREHPSPVTLRSQLATIAERQLPPACASLLGPLCPENDPSVWFIRRLDVGVAVDASWEADRLAQAWSQPVARELLRSVSSGEDGADVLRFTNRAAYLAQFLCDLADGVAWSKWYYTSFDGLRALLTTSALREALSREPATGESALLQLANDGRLEKILRAMSETDCRAVLAVFCGAGRDLESHEFTTTLLQAAWRAWQRIGLLAGEHAEAHHTSLRLYLALRNDTEAVRSSPALLRAIHALIVLARSMGSPGAGDLLRALRRGDDSATLAVRQTHDIRSLISAAFRQADDIESLVALLSCERAVVIEIAEQLRLEVQTKTAAKLSIDKPLFTSFGGIFWLLPHVDELHLDECAAVLPKFKGESPTDLVRFLVLLKCLGASRAPRAFFDPVLREVAGLTIGLDAGTVRAWARLVTPQMTRDFQKHWSTTYRRDAAVSPRWLGVRSARRWRLLLLSECEKDIWLCVTRSPDELIQTLEQQIADNTPKAVLCDPGLAQILPPCIAGKPLRPLNTPEVVAMAAEDSRLARYVDHARRLDQELSYLSLRSLLHSARHLDQTLSLLAHAALRAFAWRLPGFAWSTVDYLCKNFLDVTARIEWEEKNWRVRLTRPSLHVVLAMTGAAQDAYQISWLNKRKVNLTTAES